MQLKNDQKNISNFAKKWEKTWCQWRSLENGKVKIEDLRDFKRPKNSNPGPTRSKTMDLLGFGLGTSSLILIILVIIIRPVFM